MSEAHIVALAAAAAPGSSDPVDDALNRALKRDYPQITAPVVDPEDIDRATPDRRFSLTRVRDCDCGDGAPRDLVVMRGDLEAMVTRVKPQHELRSVVRRKAGVAIHRGWRPLAVATAPVDSDGQVGAFTMQGFVGISAQPGRSTDQDMSSSPAIWARVNVWSPALRIQHWSNVSLVFLLSCTGFFIMDPFAGPNAFLRQDNTGFLMGYVRLAHFICAFAWLVVALTRIWSAFTSSDRYLRWSALWPLKSKADLRHLGHTIQHYIFIKREAPMYLGHNPLQQLTYTAVYVLCSVQLLTGFVLFGLYHQTDPFWAFISTPIHWFGITHVRLFHALVMFLLWGFVIAHVYLVFRADSVERHGGLSAMINGGVWVRRGSKPVDAPVIE